MKKGIRLIKKLVALLLVLIFSIESLAAIVSDNDGSAFTTKAEFENLKDNFKSQIDEYNTSLDSKIDGAIASYLAGIKLSKKEQTDLLFNSWKSVTCFNGVIDPKFNYPAYDLSCVVYNTKPNSEGPKTTWHYCGYEYVKVTNESASFPSWRPLVSNVVENTQDTSFPVWDGIAYDWEENIWCVLGFVTDAGFGHIERTGNTKKFYCTNILDFVANGYISNLNSNLTNHWKVNFWYYVSSLSPYWYSTSRNSIYQSVWSNSVNYGSKSYEHIISYKNASNWNVYNRDWVNTVTNPTLDNLTIGDWFALKDTQNTDWTYLKTYGQYNVPNNTAGNNSYYTYQTAIETRCKTKDNTDTGYKIPRIGEVGFISAESMYQFKDVIKLTVGKKNTTLDQQKLPAGFVLGYALEDDKINWEPKFDNLVCNIPGVDPNTTEICLSISLKPFGDSMTNDDLISLKNFDINVGNVATSVDKKMKLEWTMPKDGFVYVKWYPKFNNQSYIDSEPWRVDLDVKNCATYIKETNDI